jgi:hypothetical protein
MYLIVHTKTEGRITRPDLPKGCQFGQLFCPARPATFGIYWFQSGENGAFPANPEYVPTPLVDLIESAKQYPPALAITRHQVAQLPCREPEELVAACAHLLKWHLERQARDPYLLVRAVAKGGLSASMAKVVGQYYWVVGVVRGFDDVHLTWVTDDYDLFSCAAQEFESDESAMASRFSGWSYWEDEV